MSELFQVVMGGDVGKIEALLRAGARADARTSKGTHWAALHAAAYKGNAGAIAALIQVGQADPDIPDDRGWTPLHLAAQENQAAAVQELVKLGASPTCKTSSGSTPLHVAAQEGQALAVLALLDSCGTSLLSVKNSAGQSPLHSAAFKGRAAAVEALLSRGASVLVADSNGDTPLHRLVEGWRPDREAQYLGTAKVLLAAGADPWLRNRSGVAAAALASSRGLAGFQKAVAASTSALGTRRSLPPVEEQEAMGEEALGNLPAEDCVPAEVARRVRGVVLLSGETFVNRPRGDGAAAAADSQPPTPKPAPEAFGRIDSSHARPPSLRSDSGKSYSHSFSSADGLEDRPGSSAGGPHPLSSQQLCGAFGRSVTIKALPPQQPAGPPASARASSPAPLPLPGRAGSPNPMAYGRSVSSSSYASSVVLEALPVPADPQELAAELRAAALAGHAERVWQLAQAGGADLVNAPSPGPGDAAGSGSAAIGEGRSNGSGGHGTGGHGGGSIAAQKGWTALHLAASKGHAEVVKILLDEGADASLVTPQGSSALHLAVCSGRVGVIHSLVAEGAPCGLRDAGGNTALHVAATRGQVSAVLALLEGGAPVDSQNRAGDTALHIAAVAGRVGVVAALVNGGANVDARGPGGATPLMGAAAAGNLAAVKALLKAEASFSAADSQGNTALHHAVLGWRAGSDEGYLSVARELLVGGCDLGAPNAAGETPFGLASAGHIRQLKELFTKAEGGVYIATLRESIRPTGAKGFWLKALANHPFLKTKITAQDAEVLHHLKSVHYEFGKGENRSHKILFFWYRDNPYFKNMLTVKEYPAVEEPSKIKGCIIEWVPGKELTPLTSATRPAAPLQPGESFFNWFRAPQARGQGVQLSHEEQEAIAEDCRIAQHIGEVLQRPADWNSGVALQDYFEAEAPPTPTPTPPPPPQQIQSRSLQQPQPQQVQSRSLQQPEQGCHFSLEQQGLMPQESHHLPPEQQGLVPQRRKLSLRVQDSLPVSELISSIKQQKGGDAASAALAVGKAALDEKRYNAALRDLTAAIELDTSTEKDVAAEAMLARSTVFLKMYNCRAAVADAQAVQKMRPYDPRGTVTEGLCRMATRDFKVAKKCFKHAIVLDPDYPDIYELRQQAKLAIKERWDKRLEAVQMFVGPICGMAITMLAL